MIGWLAKENISQLIKLMPKICELVRNANELKVNWIEQIIYDEYVNNRFE